MVIGVGPLDSSVELKQDSEESESEDITVSKQLDAPVSEPYRFNKYEDFLDIDNYEEPWRKQSPLYGLMKTEDFHTDNSMEGFNFKDMALDEEDEQCA